MEKRAEYRNQRGVGPDSDLIPFVDHIAWSLETQKFWAVIQNSLYYQFEFGTIPTIFLSPGNQILINGGQSE